MAERRTSISSNTGPALRSMALHSHSRGSLHNKNDGIPMEVSHTTTATATSSKHPPITEVMVYSTSSIDGYDHSPSNEALGCDYDGEDNRLVTRSMMMKASLPKRNGSRSSPSSTSTMKKHAGIPPATTASVGTIAAPTTASPSGTSTKTLRLIDSDNVVSSSSTDITIDMIQTLPIVDSSAIRTNNNSIHPFQGTDETGIREYISNIFMPHCRSSCCSIPNVSSLPSVLYGITNFLRIQCIPYKLEYTTTTVAFHCERNCAFASIMGASLVFVIYLWYERDGVPPDQHEHHQQVVEVSKEEKVSTDQGGKTVLVDVQRRRGCPLDLKCIRRSLFRSLLHLDTSPTSITGSGSGGTRNSGTNNLAVSESIGTRQGMIPLDICRSIWSRYNGTSTSSSITKMGTVDDASTTTVSQDDSTKGNIVNSSDSIVHDFPSDASTAELKDLDLVAHYQEMLETTNTVEQHRMALECLCHHTDSTVTDIMESRTVVEAIVCANCPINSDPSKSMKTIQQFRSNLLHILTATTSSESYEFNNCSSLESQSLTTTGCGQKNLQALVLRALFSSVHIYLTNLIHTNGTKTLLSIDTDPFWHTVMQVCRSNIGTASTGPCSATVSIILTSMLLSSDVVSDASKDMIRTVLLSNCPNHNLKNSSIVTDTKNLLLADLQDAHQWGMRHHSKLEASSKRFIEMVAQQF